MRMLSRKSAAYSNEKAERLLGYKPEFSLQHGMQSALQWAFEQGLCKAAQNSLLSKLTKQLTTFKASEKRTHTWHYQILLIIKTFY